MFRESLEDFLYVVLNLILAIKILNDKILKDKSILDRKIIEKVKNHYKEYEEAYL